jgi:hypothetical protein
VADLSAENEIVLATVQAFIGAIAPSMTAISLETNAERETVDLYVALRAPDGAVETLLDDVVTDIGVLTDDAAYVNVHTWIGDDWVTGWPGLHKRMVYAAYRRR